MNKRDGDMMSCDGMGTHPLRDEGVVHLVLIAQQEWWRGISLREREKKAWMDPARCAGTSLITFSPIQTKLARGGVDTGASR